MESTIQRALQGQRRLRMPFARSTMGLHDNPFRAVMAATGGAVLWCVKGACALKKFPVLKAWLARRCGRDVESSSSGFRRDANRQDSRAGFVRIRRPGRSLDSGSVRPEPESPGAAVPTRRALARLAILASFTIFMGLLGSSARADTSPTLSSGFRGVYFNPNLSDTPNYPWLLRYAEHRDAVQTQLRELVNETHVNLVSVFVLIAYSLKTPSEAPGAGLPVEAWANLDYLDQVAHFVDDCHDAGLQVALDLACNLWVPYSVDPNNQIGNSPYWPKPDETPWDEAATWYKGVMEYVESKAAHPESIAFWSMMGNHQWGGAEPVLWPDDNNPGLIASVERLVKEVWPVFKVAGRRPKAAPFAFPIFSNNDYWMKKTPDERLAGFINLKKWMVDDLKLPPDYWPMSTYPLCDPAPDGVYYLRRIVEILGKDQASRVVSTDFKSIGIEFTDSIIKKDGIPEEERIAWHLKKCAEYGFAGWWIWSYQDTAKEKTGLRDVAGLWKAALVERIRNSELIIAN